MATTFVAEGQHGGMAVGVGSPQGPAMLCLWPSVLAAAEVLGSLLAVWGQGHGKPATLLPQG